MDIKNITTFIQVAELCSFTKAAELLGYSQSTVSFQIRQLEEELGVRLLYRINHTVSLTAEGTRFLKAAHEINGLLWGFHSEMQSEAVSGHVRLATSDSLCHVVIGKIFPQLHACFPNITLEIIIIIGMAVAILGIARIRLSSYLKFMAIPFSFTVLTCIFLLFFFGSGKVIWDSGISIWIFNFVIRQDALDTAKEEYIKKFEGKAKAERKVFSFGTSVIETPVVEVVASEIASDEIEVQV